MKALRILVCFKIVRDLETVLEQDWLSAKDLSFDIDYTKKIISCFDESALETALYLADRAKALGTAFIETVALTISGDNFREMLKNLCAVGFSQVVNVQYGADLRFQPRAVARIISKFAQSTGGYDAILMGWQNSLGNNAQTAPITAEMLGLPCVNMVSDLDLDEDRFRVTSRMGACIRRASIGTQAVYALGNAKHTYLRMATLREKMAASHREPLIIAPEDLGLDDEAIMSDADTVVRCLRRDSKKDPCQFVQGATVEEKTKLLLENHVLKAVDIEERTEMRKALED